MKQDAVRIFEPGERTITEVSRSLNVAPSVLRSWVKQQAVDAGKGVMQVAMSGYYAWVRRPERARAKADHLLRTKVRVSHATSRRTYGSPRVHADLQAEGFTVSRNKVARLMREEGLRDASVRQRRLPQAAARQRHRLQHEPQGQLLGQRRRRELFATIKKELVALVMGDIGRYSSGGSEPG